MARDFCSIDNSTISAICLWSDKWRTFSSCSPWKWMQGQWTKNTHITLTRYTLCSACKVSHLEWTYLLAAWNAVTMSCYYAFFLVYHSLPSLCLLELTWLLNTKLFTPSSTLHTLQTSFLLENVRIWAGDTYLWLNVYVYWAYEWCFPDRGRFSGIFHLWTIAWRTVGIQEQITDDGL